MAFWICNLALRPWTQPAKTPSLRLWIKQVTHTFIMKINKSIKTTMSFAAAMGSLILAAGSANAAIVIANHSFEGPDVANFGGTPENWTIVGSEVSVYNHFGTTFSTRTDPNPDGSDQAVFSRGGDSYQVLDDATVGGGLGTNVAANTIYTMTVDVGDRSDLTFQGAELRLGIGSVFGTNLLTATVVSSDTPTYVGTNTTDGWKTWVSTFTTGASPTAGALRVELINPGTDQTLFDNVRLTAVTIPEPSTTALLGLGGLALILRCRK
jgi:hypothetical protein